MAFGKTMQMVQPTKSAFAGSGKGADDVTTVRFVGGLSRTFHFLPKIKDGHFVRDDNGNLVTADDVFFAKIYIDVIDVSGNVVKRNIMLPAQLKGTESYRVLNEFVAQKGIRLQDLRIQRRVGVQVLDTTPVLYDEDGYAVFKVAGAFTAKEGFWKFETVPAISGEPKGLLRPRFLELGASYKPIALDALLSGAKLESSALDTKSMYASLGTALIDEGFTKNSVIANYHMRVRASGDGLGRTYAFNVENVKEPSESLANNISELDISGFTKFLSPELLYAVLTHEVPYDEALKSEGIKWYPVKPEVVTGETTKLTVIDDDDESIFAD
jgi:hypothetical protein